MKRFALIENDIVSIVVEQDTQPTIGNWIDISNLCVGPGFTYTNGQFVNNQKEKRIISKIAMLTKRLTSSEFASILALAKTDSEIEAWKYVFDVSATVDLDGSNAQNGVAFFVSKGLLTQSRANAILNNPIQQDEKP